MVFVKEDLSQRTNKINNITKNYKYNQNPFKRTKTRRFISFLKKKNVTFNLKDIKKIANIKKIVILNLYGNSTRNQPKRKHATK